MKDIIIKAASIKRELIIFGICFIIANLINVYAIVSRNTRWIELISMLHIVFVLSIILYGIFWLIRSLLSLFGKKR